MAILSAIHKLAASDSKMTFDIDLTADPHTTVEVILDETTGDVVKAAAAVH